MRFSWTGVILAPLLVPLVSCAVMSFFLTNGSVPLAFLIRDTAHERWREYGHSAPRFRFTLFKT